MTAALLQGRVMSADLKTELRHDVERFQQEYGRQPRLAIVRVEGDAASGVYSKAIMRIANDIDVQVQLELLSEQTSPDTLKQKLQALNVDQDVNGIIVQMPLPAHIPQSVVADTIAVSKDIDGISPLSAGRLALGVPGFVPSTAAAVMEILARSHTVVSGKHVVVLGRSNVVGKPLAQLLLQQNATVTVCHSHTTDLPGLTRQADILVAAVGRAGFVTAEMVRPGATVIDVGINPSPDGKGIVGDVDFASVQEVAGSLTPVPGGVGPLTNAVLLKQCISAAWQQMKERAASAGNGVG